MTRVRIALGLAVLAVLVALTVRAWVRLGHIEADLRAADAELAHRD